MISAINTQKQQEIGDLVNYLFKENPCRVIATKEQPHKYHFGNEEIDKLGYERPVSDGFDLTVVETGWLSVPTSI